MKTMKQWNESKQDLDKFLQPGDIVAEDIYDYFISVLPPATFTGNVVQIGEPYDHNRRDRPRFATIRKQGGQWHYVGHLTLPEHWYEQMTDDYQEALLLLDFLPKSGSRAFHSSPSHGWLEVDFMELLALGIEDEISSYSYIKPGTQKTYVLLEEDCDAGLYMDRVRALGVKVEPVYIYVKDDQHIRSLPMYYNHMSSYTKQNSLYSIV